MKKLFLTLALAFVGIFSANAQVWIGGGLGANLHENYMNLSIAPEVGYVFNEHWQLGLGTSYSFTRQLIMNKQEEDVTTNTNELALQPYVRYVATSIEKFSLFFDLCGDFGLIDDNRGYAVTLQPGIAWMATKHWTAAFRFGKVGYDHNYYGTNGLLMNCDLASPQIRLYYNF